MGLFRAAAASGAESARAIASNTSPQAPRRGWRKSRIVGYQGKSSRSVIQRHSRVALQRDPDRSRQRAGEMGDRSVAGHDEVAMRHRRGGVDEGVGPESKSSPSVSTFIPRGRPAICSSPKPFCSETSRTPASDASGAAAASGKERARSASGWGLPCQTMPILNPAAPIRSAHLAESAGSAAR